MCILWYMVLKNRDGKFNIREFFEKSELGRLDEFVIGRKKFFCFGGIRFFLNEFFFI